MNVSRKELETIYKKPIRKKENTFIKKNQQLIRKREVDALVERTRQDIVDKYIDLEF